jgi:hypothetical protein
MSPAHSNTLLIYSKELIVSQARKNEFPLQVLESYPEKINNVMTKKTTFVKRYLFVLYKTHSRIKFRDAKHLR